MKCSACGKTFHKSHCLRLHACNTVSQSSSNPNDHLYPTTTPNVDDVVMSSRAVVPSLGSVISMYDSTSVPPSSSLLLTPALDVNSSTSTCLPLVNSTGVEQFLPEPRRFQELTTQTSTVSSALNPRASLFQPKSLIEKQKKRSQSIKPHTVTKEKAEIDSLKIELSFAQTKIVELESKKKDQENSLKIYEQKLKLLETERLNNLKEKYYPSAHNISSQVNLSGDSDQLLCKCKLQSQIIALTKEVDRLSKKLFLQTHPENVSSNPTHQECGPGPQSTADVTQNLQEAPPILPQDIPENNASNTFSFEDETYDYVASDAVNDKCFFDSSNTESDFEFSPIHLN